MVHATWPRESFDFKLSSNIVRYTSTIELAIQVRDVAIRTQFECNPITTDFYNNTCDIDYR